MGGIGPTTELQLRVWLVWLEEQWNHPSRSDYYLMAVALEIRRVLAKNPNEHKLSDLQLQFQVGGAKKGPASDTAVQQDMAFWRALAGEGKSGLKVIKTVPPRPGAQGKGAERSGSGSA